MACMGFLQQVVSSYSFSWGHAHAPAGPPLPPSCLLLLAVRVRCFVARQIGRKTGLAGFIWSWGVEKVKRSARAEVIIHLRIILAWC